MIKEWNKKLQYLWNDNKNTKTQKTRSQIKW